MRELHIRAFAESDADVVVTLVENILAEYMFSAAQVGSIRQDIIEIREWHDSARGGLWVAVLGGEIVGTVAIRPKADRTCELKRLYLRSDIRGGGAGQALYDHAEAFARAAGYDRIWLDSSRRFTLARRLYERNGFTLLENIDNEWEDAVYAKRLTVLTQG